MLTRKYQKITCVPTSCTNSVYKPTRCPSIVPHVRRKGFVWGCFTCESLLDVLSPLWWYVQGFTNLGCVLTVRDSRQLGFLPGAHALETIPAMHCYHTEDLYGGCNFIHWNATQVEPIGLAVCTLNLNYHFQVFGYLGFFSCTHARTHQQLLVHQRILEC